MDYFIDFFFFLRKSGLPSDVDSTWVTFFFLIFIYLFMAVLGLRFCARAFSSCGKRGPLLIAVRRPLIIAASLLLWSTGSRRTGSVIVAHGPSYSAACGIFPDQGSNPCPLHWQADSQPLRHQGSPTLYIFFSLIYFKIVPLQSWTNEMTFTSCLNSLIFRFCS